MAIAWFPAARADLARIFEFNLAFSLDRAELVDARPRGTREALEATPWVGRPTRIANVREVSLVDIQYVIRYLAEAEAVTVLHVRSTREGIEAR